jgi:hypothetical protein
VSGRSLGHSLVAVFSRLRLKLPRVDGPSHGRHGWPSGVDAPRSLIWRLGGGELSHGDSLCKPRQCSVSAGNAGEDL